VTVADIVIEHHHHLALDESTKTFFLDLIKPIMTALAHLETTVATEADAINALTAKVDDLIADVRAALAVIAGPDNTLGVEGQAALDGLVAKVDAFDAQVGDADGSDTPV